MTHTTEMEIIMKNDKLVIGGHEFNSRFILGSGKYFGLHSGRDNAIAEYQWRQNG